MSVDVVIWCSCSQREYIECGGIQKHFHFNLGFNVKVSAFRQSILSETYIEFESILQNEVKHTSKAKFKHMGFEMH